MQSSKNHDGENLRGLADFKLSDLLISDENDFLFQTYVPKSLYGIVDVIVQYQSSTPSSYKVLPNGKIELQFLLEGSDVLDNKFEKSSGNNSQFAYLFSATSKPHYPAFKKINMVLIIMSPIAAKLLFGLPAYVLKNSCIEPLILKNCINEIQDQLNSLPTFQDRARFLEMFLFRRMQESPDSFMMGKLLAQIEIINGQANSSWHYTRLNLDHINFSKSHFHRLCNDWLGMSYYSHIQLQQFRDAAFSLVEANNLTDLALEHNYYDQAHFSRKFRQFADMTPGEFKNATKQEDRETIVLPPFD